MLAAEVGALAYRITSMRTQMPSAKSNMAPNNVTRADTNLVLICALRINVRFKERGVGDGQDVPRASRASP